MLASDQSRSPQYRLKRSGRLVGYRRLTYYRNFIDTAIVAPVDYSRSEVCLASARLPKNPKSNLSFWRLLCPPITPRTVPLCVLSPLPMAATAAFLDRPPIRISAPSTPARTHKPLLARPPARTSPITFPAATCPPAISAPPSDASSPPSLKVKSNPKPPPPSPISAKPSCKPCPSPSTNTSTPTAPTPGAKPSASPTNSPPITSSLIHHRQRQRQSPNRNRLQPQPQPLLPRRHQTHLPPPSKIVTAHLWSLSSRSGGL